MPTPPSAVARIQALCARFGPALAHRKLAAIRRNPFSFFRGTNHLFVDDWPGGGLDDAPSSWISGDLHAENFGVYRADNQLAYFDVNDFDEACLAPVTRDVTRLLTSIIIAGPTWDGAKASKLTHSTQWCNVALDAYSAALAQGKPHVAERTLATGTIKKLFTGARRTRRILLDEHTTIVKGKRRFVADNEHIVAAPDNEIAMVHALVDVAITHITTRNDAPRPRFFRILDVARRVAGVGSLGARRYIVLIEGNGAPHRHRLLDVKEALPSVAMRAAPPIQPVWASDAERVTVVQRRVQSEAPAWLVAVPSSTIGFDDGTSFVVRRLQPIANRLSLAGRRKRITGELLAELARITAWSHLRGVGWHGGPTADALIEFGARRDWHENVLAYARAYADVVARDFQDFAAAYDQGGFTSSNASNGEQR